jgi:hypothetical protein
MVTMPFVRNLSVRGKLLGGFGIVVALIVVLGVVLLSELGRSTPAGCTWARTRF